MVIKNKKLPKRQPWRKVLYANYEYPDNYTDKSFLDELKKNIYVRNVNYVDSFAGASLITQQICLVTLFLLTYLFLLNDWIVLEYLFIFNLLNFIFFYFLVFNTIEIFKQIRLMAAFIFLFILSPVLKSLTQTISTDTIYACSVISIVVHLFLNDYTKPVYPRMKVVVSNSLSLNSIVFCSVCLASRLSSNYHVFLLLINTVEYFVFYPYLFKLYNFYIQRYIMLMLCLVLLFKVCTISVFYLFTLCILLINVICPYWFVKWYSYKHNIYGPWDEATISSSQLIL